MLLWRRFFIQKSAHSNRWNKQTQSMLSAGTYLLVLKFDTALCGKEVSSWISPKKEFLVLFFVLSMSETSHWCNSLQTLHAYFLKSIILYCTVRNIDTYPTNFLLCVDLLLISIPFHSCEWSHSTIEATCALIIVTEHINHDMTQM